jgi:hypothetical protein
MRILASRQLMSSKFIKAKDFPPRAEYAGMP